MKIKIDFTESDLQDLINGETFDWNFETDTGETVDVHLYNSDLEEDAGDYAHCADCDRIIDLDNNLWTADQNDTYCSDCSKEGDKIMNKKLLQDQEQIALEMQNIGFNVVTCGNCGDVFFHRCPVTITPDGDADLTCPYCEYTSDICDFPDFIYSGMADNLTSEVTK